MIFQHLVARVFRADDFSDCLSLPHSWLFIEITKYIRKKYRNKSILCSYASNYADFCMVEWELNFSVWIKKKSKIVLLKSNKNKWDWTTYKKTNSGRSREKKREKERGSHNARNDYTDIQYYNQMDSILFQRFISTHYTL